MRIGIPYDEFGNIHASEPLAPPQRAELIERVQQGGINEVWIELLQTYARLGRREIKRAFLKFGSLVEKEMLEDVYLEAITILLKYFNKNHTNVSVFTLPQTIFYHTGLRHAAKLRKKLSTEVYIEDLKRQDNKLKDDTSWESRIATYTVTPEQDKPNIESNQLNLLFEKAIKVIEGKVRTYKVIHALKFYKRRILEQMELDLHPDCTVKEAAKMCGVSHESVYKYIRIFNEAVRRVVIEGDGDTIDEGQFVYLIHAGINRLSRHQQEMATARESRTQTGYSLHDA